MKKITHMGMILALMVAMSLYAKKPNHTQLQTTLSKYLEVIAHNQNFSGEILIVQDEEHIFNQRVGFASIEHKVALTEGAKYRIASISKTMTAALVLMAQQDNRLKLTDHVIQYLPQLAVKFSNITIADLLSHRSGLPHHEGIEDYWLIKSKLQMTPDQAIQEINQMNLLYEPDLKMHYSSPGYYLLATMLEQIYDQPFVNLRQDRILDKLKMTETGQRDNLDILPNMANGYHLLKEELKVAPFRNYSMLKGAGDMYSTATDLMKWAKAIQRGTLLNSTEWQIFYKASDVGESSEVVYDFGWYRSLKDVKKFYHGGGTWGYSSYLAIYPDTKTTIILLSNVSQLAVNEIGETLEQILFSHDFKMPALHTVIAKDSLYLDQYTGVFKSAQDKIGLRVFKVDDGLFVKLGNNPAFRIYNKDQHHFFGKKVNVELIFETRNKQVVALSANRMGQTIHFIKDSKVKEDEG